MAVSLGQGFAPYFLIGQAAIAKENNPTNKLDPFGFTNLLQSQTSKGEVTLNSTKAGHKRSVRVKKIQRLTKDFVDNSKSCTTTNVIPYSENDVDLSITKQVAIHVSDEEVAQYQEEASNTVLIGSPSVGIMNALYERVLASCNAILDSMNADLLTLAVASVGVNRRTGSAAASTINLELTTTNNPLSNGETQMLADYKNNLGVGRPQIVGSGLFSNYVWQQVAKTANASNGIDTRVQTAMFDYFHDLELANKAGANQVIVYQPNSVQLVEYLEYTGFKAGQKPDGSFFGTLRLPSANPFGVQFVDFDFQLKYNSCQETFTDAYYGTELSLEKGWNIIISKQAGLWTIPSDAYRLTDVMSGNRGSLRYTITNS